MKILVQHYKTGKVKLIETPIPSIPDDFILVKTNFSAISIGTELARVSSMKNILNLILQRKDYLEKVWKILKDKGISETYRIIMNKLDTYVPLGYSLSGKVVKKGKLVDEVSIGDYVACAGAEFAFHAEYVAIPKNMFVKVDPKYLKEASFTTIGAIALHSIRRANVSIGEWVCVVGLGLVGQIAVRLLKLSGANVIGIDIDDFKMDKARPYAEHVFNFYEENLATKIEHITKHGVDKVLVCAPDSSGRISRFAGEIARDRASIIFVGRNNTNVPWESFYFKEMNLLASRAYGAGRYDPKYEVEGLDYPIGYVRWTIRRNMQAFVEKLPYLNLSEIITHEYPFEKAEEVYESLLKSKESFIGVVFRYSSPEKETLPKHVNVSTFKAKSINVAFIGAGNYATNFLIPAFLSNSNVSIKYIVARRMEKARRIAERYNVAFISSDPKEVFEDDDVNLVVIATPHNTHYNFLKQALLHRKAVYVEKPMVLTMEQLMDINEIYTKHPVPLTVGFNRRFSKHLVHLKNKIRKGAFMNVLYRINAGKLENHWLTDMKVGGGRYLGEGIHFLDVCLYLFEDEPKQFQLLMHDNGNFVLSLRFNNGLAVINYYDSGNQRLEKEYLEVSTLSDTFQMYDYTRTFINGKLFMKTKQDKGVSSLVQAFVEHVLGKRGAPIPWKDIFNSHYYLFKALRQASHSSESYFNQERKDQS